MSPVNTLFDSGDSGNPGDHGTPPSPPGGRIAWAEILVAAGAFAVLCIVVLAKATRLVEPDDYAYRAAIIALTHGHIILTNTQYQDLLQQLGTAAQPGIEQWTHLANGSWVSEKIPGYSFFAAPFQMLGMLRLAPLFYGALGCFGLFVGARRWLGRWGGTWAVVLFCSSGAAISFAWRATMPTFTDASLIAAGTGALLWTLLATEASGRGRTVVGLLAFLALEGATFIRFTDGVILLVAVIAVLLARRAAQLSLRMLTCWSASLVGFVALVAAYNAMFYGGATKTGYTAGVITFSLGALLPNLKDMPAHLVSSMPFVILAAVAVVWIAVRAVHSRRSGFDRSLRAAHRRDAAVGAALCASWIGIYGLYLAYDWTVSLAGGQGSTIQVIRFYVPALAAVALLGAWLITRLPRWTAFGTLAVIVCLGAVSYPGLANTVLARPGGPAGQGELIGSPPNGQAPSGAPPRAAPAGP
ncbi:MAG TPA: hypothetical protein VFH61_02070 [Thermoleophilia bacterium]|nr:hypothetical protein [Thermoleophilia bacterium]